MEFIKECLSELKLRFRMESAIAEKLEHHDKEIYALRENEKLYKASITKLTQEVQQLRLMLSKQKAV